MQGLCNIGKSMDVLYTTLIEEKIAPSQSSQKTQKNVTNHFKVKTVNELGIERPQPDKSYLQKTHS